MQVDHINLVVRDLDGAVAFYTEVLGLEVTMRAKLEGEWIDSIAGLEGVVADCVYLQPPAGGPRIELLRFQYPESDSQDPHLPNAAGFRHVAFRVEDIEAAYQALREKGVIFQSPPVAVPEEVVKHGSGRKRLCYFHDPEGNLLEIAEFR